MYIKVSFTLNSFIHPLYVIRYYDWPSHFRYCTYIIVVVNKKLVLSECI